LQIEQCGFALTVGGACTAFTVGAEVSVTKKEIDSLVLFIYLFITLCKVH
jgi:hypothetical protein